MNQDSKIRLHVVAMFADLRGISVDNIPITTHCVKFQLLKYDTTKLVIQVRVSAHVTIYPCKLNNN